jgi:hypothetical protein
MATKVTPLRTKEQRQSVRELAAAEMGVLRFITCGSQVHADRPAAV